MRHLGLLLFALGLSACSLFGTEKPRYVVFFEERSIALDPEAERVIGLAASRAQQRPEAAVEVLGYTDSAGNASADVTLSEQRARIVADTLVARGVAPGRLIREGRGQTGEDPGVASRRVEIAIRSAP